jgi:pimeloyl-ACP methyl ester carboxylesterase
MRKRYNESDIILVGFSMGTVPTAMLAANYNPRAVVIEGSVVSVFEKGKRTLPFLPTSLIARYNMDIRKFLPEIKVPVLIFHGEIDPGSPVDIALKMKPFLKPTDKFIILTGQGHKDFIFNDQYYKELTTLINN